MATTEIDSYELSKLQKDADQLRSTEHWIWLSVKIVAGIVAGILAIVFLFKGVGPQLNLYRANTEKQAQIAEAESESKAAEYKALSAVTQAKALADAEIERARGTAAAMEIIDGTLSEPYLRYLYIQSLDVAGASVIYVPTEAGLPILEAGRATQETTAP